jgi:hypothetical protein
MNEKQFGYRVKLALNRALTLDEQTLGRLSSARFRALQAQQLEDRSLILVTAGNANISLDNRRSIATRILLPLLVLVVGLFASNHWYQSQLQQEIIEIDTEVLTGDLPIDAYLDRGFDAWLKRSSD